MKKTAVLLFVFFINIGLWAQEQKKFSSSSYNFIENKGQIVDLDYNPNKEVLFLFNGNGLNVHLRQTGFSYDVYTVERIPRKPAEGRLLAAKFNEVEEDINWHYHRVDIELIGCNTSTSVETKGKSVDYINYYTAGTPAEGILKVHHYSEVYYHNVYDNIDLQFLIKDGKPKYNFILYPGADLTNIKLQFKNAVSTKLSGTDKIIIKTREGDVVESMPECYYPDGKKVAINFKSLGKDTYGFEGEYDKYRTVIIDPTPLRAWATYFGGGAEDFGTSVTTDLSNNVYFAGYTLSTTNIASNGHQSYLAGSNDAFLSKFTPSGQRAWATYYGGSLTGSGDDRGNSVCSDASGNIYLAGSTSSPNNIGYNGFRDTAITLGEAFLVKFTTNGIRVWGTYYGGQGNDAAYSVCSDKNANIYLVGETRSANYIAFNGHQNTFASSLSVSDGFIVKFDSSCNRLWGTYFGGVNTDVINGACADDSGNLFVAGYTTSTSGIYLNGHQSYFAGNSDIIAAKFSPSGTLIWGTFYGGPGADIAYEIAADKSNNLYITGMTGSTSGFYFNGWDNNNDGNGDAFLLKFNNGGARLWATYFGGSAADEAKGITVDNDANIFICGITKSSSKIIKGGFQATIGSTNTDDGFIAEYDSSCRHLWSTYYGGSSHDYCYGLSYDGTYIYVGGSSYSNNNITTSSSYQASLGGIADAFIAKLEIHDIVLSNIPQGPFCEGDTFSVDYRYIGSNALSSNNEFSVFVYDSSKNNSYKSASLKTTDTAGKILITVTKNTYQRYGLTFSGWASDPRVYGTYTDTFTINNTPNNRFDFSGFADTAKCLKGNTFRFSNNYSDKIGITYKMWDFGDGDTSSQWDPFKSYAAHGTYTVTFKTFGPDYGCTSKLEKKAYVRPTPKASFTVNDSIICRDETVFFTNTSTSSGEFLSYDWLLDGSFSTTVKDPSRKYTTVRNQNVRLVTTNIYNCKDTAFKTISINPIPSVGFNINYTNRCLNGNSILCDNISSIATGMLTYNWQFGDGDSSDIKSPVKSYATSGSKSITLTATSDIGCIKSTNKTALILPSPIANFTINNDTQCFNGHQFAFTNTSSLPGGGTLTYSWLAGGKTSTTLSPTFTYAGPGNHTAYLVARATTGCSDSVTKNFSLLPSPQPVITGPDVSKGKKQETYSVANTGGTYLWSVSSGTIVSGQGTNQVSVLWDENPGSFGQLFLIQTNTFGCASTPANKVVLLSPSNISQAGDLLIRVYPNPSYGEISIHPGDYNGSYNIKVFNRLGQIIATEKNKRGNVDMDISDYPAGLYFVRIEGDNFIVREKIILK